MKKIYMTPELEEVKIQTVGILALSAGGFTDNESDLLAPEAGFDFGAGDDFDFSDGDAFTFEEEKFDLGE